MAREGKLAPVDDADETYVVGKKYYFWTVTYAWLGEIVSISLTQIALKGVSLVFETGPFADFFAKGLPKSSEILPADQLLILERGVMTAGTPWKHELPKKSYGT